MLVMNIEHCWKIKYLKDNINNAYVYLQADNFSTGIGLHTRHQLDAPEFSSAVWVPLDSSIGLLSFCLESSLTVSSFCE